MFVEFKIFDRTVHRKDTPDTVHIDTRHIAAVRKGHQATDLLLDGGHVISVIGDVAGTLDTLELAAMEMLERQKPRTVYTFPDGESVDVTNLTPEIVEIIKDGKAKPKKPAPSQGAQA